MKKLFILLTAVIVLAVNSTVMADVVNIDDGASHIINDNTYDIHSVFLDEIVANNPGTHVYLEGVGTVGYNLHAYNNAEITMTGGSVGDNLRAYNNATINMSGGSVVNRLEAYGGATIIMTGGSVGDDLIARTNTTITISGGSVGGYLRADHDGTIYLDGTGFQITDLDGNTASLSNGDKLSDFGTLVESRISGEIWDYYTGTITGILTADGAALNDEFKIWNIGEAEGTADIYITPEPTTLLLLGLGGLVLRRRKV